MYSHHSKNGGAVATPAKPRERTILMETDGWQLVRSFYPNILGVDSFPVHVACGGNGVSRSGSEEDNFFGNKCSYCSKSVPDEIMGLWTLHNWDKATK